MNTRELNFNEISRIVSLLRQCDGTNDVKVSDLAKEGGWKKTDLTEYINENIGHFNIRQKVEKKPHKIPGYGTTYTEKPLGLFLTKCYENVIDNPETEEWLNDHIEKYKNTIWLEQEYYDYGCYGCTLVYKMCVSTDERKAKWENTKEKLSKVLEIAGDKFTHKIDGENVVYFECTDNLLDLLRKNGFSINRIMMM